MDASRIGGPITTDPRCAALPGGPRPDPEPETGGGDLIAFLRARLDEDERAAMAAARAANTDTWIDGAEGSVLGIGGDMHLRGAVNSIDDIGPHVARWDPARVLAEVEAKRRILDLAEATLADGAGNARDEHGVFFSNPIARRRIRDVLRVLALPHADHPDYRPEWQV